MKPTRLLVAFVCVTLFSRDGVAQEPVIRLTLDEAIARGLEHSHRLAELQARQQGADAAEAAQAAARLPSVALQGGYTRTNHVDEFGIVQPGQPPRIIYPDIPDNYRARIDLNWPLYSGGRTDALERAAAAEGHAAEADVAAARADLRLEIARAFWALISATETAQVLERSLENAAAHVADLRSRFEQGLLPPNEVLSAEAQASRQRVLSIESHNMRAIAEADLRRLLGLDGAERVEPVSTLDEPAAPPATVEGLLAEARKARPELRATSDRTAASRAREAAVAATARPQIGVNGGYDYARPNARIFPRQGSWQDSWDVSVNASWLLWDGGRRRAEIAGVAAASRALEARAADLDRQIAFEVRQRWLELESSRAAIGAAADGVRSATEARRVVMERFRAGVITSSDVLDADLAVLQAELDLTRSRAQAHLAQARLDRAVGR
jgi:outer membrane protein TolC